MLLGLNFIAKPQSGLENKKVLSGSGTILMPDNFEMMDSGLLALKYPNAAARPSEVYTNAEGTINIALNHTQNGATDDDLPEVKKAMEAQFNRAPFSFVSGEIKEINEKSFVVLEFVSPAVDTRIYNLMAIGSLEDRLVMITFNCTEKDRQGWESVGKKIINSINLSN
jgi:hypothetical protein